MTIETPGITVQTENGLGGSSTLVRIGGTAGNDLLWIGYFNSATVGNLRLDGGAGNDVLRVTRVLGSSFADAGLFGGPGDDVLQVTGDMMGLAIEGDGPFTLDGGSGDDTIDLDGRSFNRVGAAGPQVDGGSGFDTLVWSGEYNLGMSGRQMGHSGLWWSSSYSPPLGQQGLPVRNIERLDLSGHGFAASLVGDANTGRFIAGTVFGADDVRALTAGSDFDRSSLAGLNLSGQGGVLFVELGSNSNNTLGLLGFQSLGSTQARGQTWQTWGSGELVVLTHGGPVVTGGVGHLIEVDRSYANNTQLLVDGTAGRDALRSTDPSARVAGGAGDDWLNFGNRNEQAGSLEEAGSLYGPINPGAGLFGEAGNDWLTVPHTSDITGADYRVDGGAGDDQFDPRSHDSFGSSGSSGSRVRVDGGAGWDTLHWNLRHNLGTGLEQVRLDANSLPANHALAVANIEHLALAPTGWAVGRLATLSAADVQQITAGSDFDRASLPGLGLSGRGQVLFVTQASGDTAAALGLGYTARGSLSWQGQTWQVYQNGEAVLLSDRALSLSPALLPQMAFSTYQGTLDIRNGTAGNDVMRLGTGAGQMVGTVQLNGGAGNDLLEVGHVEGATAPYATSPGLFGGTGNDTLRVLATFAGVGIFGNDSFTLDGGAGNDTLELQGRQYSLGDARAAVLNGGSGFDTLVWNGVYDLGLGTSQTGADTAELRYRREVDVRSIERLDLSAARFEVRTDASGQVLSGTLTASDVALITRDSNFDRSQLAGLGLGGHGHTLFVELGSGSNSLALLGFTAAGTVQFGGQAWHAWRSGEETVLSHGGSVQAGHPGRVIALGSVAANPLPWIDHRPVLDGSAGSDQLSVAAGAGQSSHGATVRGGGGDDVLTLGTVHADANLADTRQRVALLDGGDGDDTLRVLATDGAHGLDGTRQVQLLGGQGDDRFELTGLQRGTALSADQANLLDGGAGSDTLVWNLRYNLGFSGDQLGTARQWPASGLQVHNIEHLWLQPEPGSAATTVTLSPADVAKLSAGSDFNRASLAGLGLSGQGGVLFVHHNGNSTPLLMAEPFVARGTLAWQGQTWWAYQAGATVLLSDQAASWQAGHHLGDLGGNNSLSTRNGSAGDDVLQVAARSGETALNLHLDGAAGNDRLAVWALHSNGVAGTGLYGGAGDDVLQVQQASSAGAEPVHLDGGSGDDLIEVASASTDNTTLRAGALADGGAGFDTLRWNGHVNLGPQQVQLAGLAWSARLDVQNIERLDLADTTFQTQLSTDGQRALSGALDAQDVLALTRGSDFAQSSLPGLGLAGSGHTLFVELGTGSNSLSLLGFSAAGATRWQGQDWLAWRSGEALVLTHGGTVHVPAGGRALSADGRDRPLYGGGGDDQLQLSAADGVAEGGAGNDWLTGITRRSDGFGSTVPPQTQGALHGGAGDDVLRLAAEPGTRWGWAPALLDGGAGHDRIDPGTLILHALSASGAGTVVDGGSGVDSFVWLRGQALGSGQQQAVTVPYLPDDVSLRVDLRSIERLELGADLGALDTLTLSPADVLAITTGSDFDRSQLSGLGLSGQGRVLMVEGGAFAGRLALDSAFVAVGNTQFEGVRHNAFQAGEAVLLVHGAAATPVQQAVPGQPDQATLSRLAGTEGKDTLSVGIQPGQMVGNLRLDGGAGDDLLVVGHVEGATLPGAGLFGGAGNDSLRVLATFQGVGLLGNSSFTLDGGAGDDLFDLQGRQYNLLGDRAGAMLVDGGTGFDTLHWNGRYDLGTLSSQTAADTVSDLFPRELQVRSIEHLDLRYAAADWYTSDNQTLWLSPDDVTRITAGSDFDRSQLAGLGLSGQGQVLVVDLGSRNAGISQLMLDGFATGGTTVLGGTSYQAWTAGAVVLLTHGGTVQPATSGRTLTNLTGALGSHEHSPVQALLGSSLADTLRLGAPEYSGGAVAQLHNVLLDGRGGDDVLAVGSVRGQAAAGTGLFGGSGNDGLYVYADVHEIGLAVDGGFRLQGDAGDDRFWLKGSQQHSAGSQAVQLDGGTGFDTLYWNLAYDLSTTSSATGLNNRATPGAVLRELQVHSVERLVIDSTGNGGRFQFNKTVLSAQDVLSITAGSDFDRSSLPGLGLSGQGQVLFVDPGINPGWVTLTTSFEALGSVHHNGQRWAAYADGAAVVLTTQLFDLGLQVVGAGDVLRTLTGTAGTDTLRAVNNSATLGGNVRLLGEAGNDLLEVNAVSGPIDPQAGLFGGAGQDFLRVFGLGGDNGFVMDGGSGNDTIELLGAVDNQRGAQGPLLDGGAGFDTLLWTLRYDLGSGTDQTGVDAQHPSQPAELRVHSLEALTLASDQVHTLRLSAADVALITAGSDFDRTLLGEAGTGQTLFIRDGDDLAHQLQLSGFSAAGQRSWDGSHWQLYRSGTALVAVDSASGLQVSTPALATAGALAPAQQPLSLDLDSWTGPPDLADLALTHPHPGTTADAWL